MAHTPTPVRGVVLVSGSRLLETGTLPQRLLWGSVRVAVLTSASDTNAHDQGVVLVVSDGDEDKDDCVTRALAGLALPGPCVVVMLHDDDYDDDFGTVKRAASVGVRVVRVASSHAAETFVAHTHAAAGALLVGVYMHASREASLLARGLLPRVAGAHNGADATFRGVVFERMPHTPTSRLAAAPALDAVVHKVTDDLADGYSSACRGCDAWPPAARALAAVTHITVVDPVAAVMHLGDRWTTEDVLTAAGVPTPPSARVPAGACVDDALVTILAAHVSFPVIVKPRDACGTYTAHGLAVVLAPAGLAGALASVGRRRAWLSSPSQPSLPSSLSTSPSSSSAVTHCDVLIQQYVDHGGILHKAYVAGDAVHVTQRPSLPDLGAATAASEAAPAGIDASHTSHTHADPSWVPFDSTRPACTAAVLAATAVAATARQSPLPTTPAPLAPDAVSRVARLLASALGVTLFGFDGVVERTSGRLLVVDVNYFPSLTGVPPTAVADTVRAAVCRST